MEKPIPAFYCCYLLRSTARRAALYVGSTPNPVRRLKQHNGVSNGGAVRTSSDSLRPWEMACIVTGFPSRIAALQFEWAWQKTHLTRHVPSTDRITTARTGKTRKGPARPSLTLANRLSNLHLLLRVKSFGRWPLRVTFFAEDAHRVWEEWTQKTPFRLRADIIVEVEKKELPQAFQRPGAEVAAEDGETIGRGKGIEGIEVAYEGAKAHLEKSKTMLEEGGMLACGVCKEHLRSEQSLTVVCPEEGCRAVSHLACLSQLFLQQEGKTGAMVPLQGRCPGCHKTLQWSTLMKDLSLRMRGQKVVASLFRKRRKKGAEPAKGTVAAAMDALDSDATSEDGETGAQESENELLPFFTPRDFLSLGSEEYEDVDEWYSRKDDMDMGFSKEEERAAGVSSAAGSAVAKASTPAKSAALFIDDSDWDDAEILD